MVDEMLGKRSGRGRPAEQRRRWGGKRLILYKGDGVCAGHDGKHRVLLYRQPAVEVESLPFEVILVQSGYNDRILVFLSVGRMNSTPMSSARVVLGANESCRGNGQQDNDQGDIFVITTHDASKVVNQTLIKI